MVIIAIWQYLQYSQTQYTYDIDPYCFTHTANMDALSLSHNLIADYYTTEIVRRVAMCYSILCYAAIYSSGIS